MGRWRLNDAQKHLAEVVEKALTEGPQTIALTRGRSVVVTSGAKRSSGKTSAIRKTKGRPTVIQALLAAPHIPDFQIPRQDEYPTPPSMD